MGGWHRFAPACAITKAAAPRFALFEAWGIGAAESPKILPKGAPPAADVSEAFDKMLDQISEVKSSDQLVIPLARARSAKHFAIAEHFPDVVIEDAAGDSIAHYRAQLVASASEPVDRQIIELVTRRLQPLRHQHALIRGLTQCLLHLGVIQTAGGGTNIGCGL